MATGDRKDPLHGFNFRFEVDKSAVAGFREVGGLSFTINSVDYREGNDPQLHVRKIPGLAAFGNITLKRGIGLNRDLWNWYRSMLNGAADRRDGSIVLQDEERNDVLRWNFSNAWITKWEGPAMNATSNDVAIESIELAVEHVELV
jgi:phage tail-like protein